MKYRCRGMKHIFEEERIAIDSACVGCEITTDGSFLPDRCVFSHGPDCVRWYEIEDDTMRELAIAKEREKNDSEV
jgi:hypothetical protein